MIDADIQIYRVFLKSLTSLVKPLKIGYISILLRFNIDFMLHKYMNIHVQECMMIMTQQLKGKKCKEIRGKLENVTISHISALFRWHFECFHFSTKMRHYSNIVQDYLNVWFPNWWTRLAGNRHEHLAL